MGNCASSKGPEAGEAPSRQLVSDCKPSVLAYQLDKPPVQLGRTGSAAFLDKCSRDGAQLLLARPSSVPSAPSSSRRSSTVEKYCTPSPILPAGTPRRQSSTSSYCKPYIESHKDETQDQATNPSPPPSPSCYLRETFPQPLTLPEGDTPKPFVSRRSSLSSPGSPSPLSMPHRSSLPINCRHSARTSTPGSLLKPAPRSQTPSPAASMTLRAPQGSKAAVSTADAACLASKQGAQEQPGTPGSGTEQHRCKGLSDRPHSSARTSLSPCSTEASSTGIPHSRFAQQGPAEGKTNCRASLAEDAAPHSTEDWRSLHVAMAVAAELGEDVLPPSEDKDDAADMEACASGSLPMVGKETALTGAQPQARNARHSISCYGSNPGSSRLSHTGSARTSAGGRNSYCSSSSARRSPASNTLARLSSAIARPFVDSLQPLSPRVPGKRAASKPQLKVTAPGSLGLTTHSISDPQVPLSTVLSSPLYLPCNGCSNGLSECRALSKCAAVLPPHGTAVHTCTLKAAQQQQQQQQQVECGNIHGLTPAVGVPGGARARGRRASVHSQPQCQIGLKIVEARDRSSSPAAVRDGHERLALQSYFSPVRLS